MQTIKAAAVEPVCATQWEERLAAYVKHGFRRRHAGRQGQNAIQYVNKLSTAALLLFGAKAVIDSDLTVGELVAFNMIAAQVALPVLRLSQFWQDFQQVQVSVERLGDILNAPAEPRPSARSPARLRAAKSSSAMCRFRYRPGMPLRAQADFDDASILARSSALSGRRARANRRSPSSSSVFYIPEEGQVLLDDADLGQVDPAWLRSHIGVVLQENLLFNRTIHDNIALAHPGHAPGPGDRRGAGSPAPTSSSASSRRAMTR